MMGLLGPTAFIEEQTGYNNRINSFPTQSTKCLLNNGNAFVVQNSNFNTCQFSELCLR